MLGDVDAMGRIGRAGAARDEAHARPARQSTHRRRHHRRARFLPADRDRDAGIIKRIEGREIGFAGNAEHPVDALGDQLIDENLPA